MTGTSLARWLSALAAQRLRAALLTLAALLALALALRLALPSSRVATIEVRATFEGVDRGTYPNGLPFSGEELIAETVLREVFTKQQMERYGTFEAFSTGFAVVRENPDLERLVAEFTGRLADTRLSPVERSRVEDEYRRRRAAATAQGRFTLLWRDPPGFGRPPRDELRALLEDVPGTWQYQARQSRRATSYNLVVLSENILQPRLLEGEEYVIAVDVLRAKIDRLIAMVDQLMRIPGAGAIRGGPRNVSLAELRARLQDVQRFEIPPLVVLARTNGLVRDPVRLRVFLDSRRDQAQLDMQEGQDRVAALQRAANDYVTEAWQPSTASSQPGSAPGGLPGRQAGDEVTAIIPQIGDTFLGQLAESASRGSDTDYRQRVTNRIVEEQEKLVELRREQAYYDELRRALAMATSAPPPSGAQAAFDRRFRATLDGLRQVIAEVQALYADLSKRNLDPLENLYAVTRPPAVRTESSLALSRLVVLSLLASGALYAALAWIHRRLQAGR